MSIFVCYSSADREWRDRLLSHIAQAHYPIELWDHEDIPAGDDVRSALERRLARTRIAVVLLSADLLSSQPSSLPIIRALHAGHVLKVIGAVIRPCRWRDDPWLRTIPTRPREDTPISTGTPHRIEEQFLAIASELRDLYLEGASSATSAAAHARRPPAPAAPLCVGRSHLVDDLVDRLLGSLPAAIPLLGPPGIGKSTVALNVLHDSRLSARYSNRRYFLRCDAHESVTSLASALADRLQVTVDQLFKHEFSEALDLVDSPTLLILDNAETPWEYDEQTEQLLIELSAIPGLAVIATIRGAARPFGPAWQDSVHLQPLGDKDASEAFLRVAGRRFEHDSYLSRVIAQLGGIPLAVALLGHIAQAEPDLAGLSALWHSKRTMLFRRRDGRTRVNDLEWSIELSIDSRRMTASSLRLLSTIAFLPDGVAHDDLPHLPAGDAVGALRQVGLAFDDAKRLRMLGPIRDYVCRHHPASPEDVQTLTRHYVALARQLVAAFREGDIVTTQRRLSQESLNLEILVLRALEAPPSPISVEAMLTLMDALNCALADIVSLATRAFTYLSEHGDVSGAGRCQQLLGDFRLSGHRLREATDAYIIAIELFQKAPDPVRHARSVQSLAEVSLRLMHYAKARDSFTLALHLSREADDAQGEAQCLCKLGEVAMLLHDYDEAHQRYVAAASAFSFLGNQVGGAHCLHGLGRLALTLRQFPIAEERLSEALRIFRQLDHPIGEVLCLHARTDLASATQDRDAFLRFSKATLALYFRLHRPLELPIIRLA